MLGLLVLAAVLQGGGGLARVVEAGDQSNIEEPRQAVARSAAEWGALWRQHDFDRGLPPVDFDKEMVVGVFLGSRLTAGFGVELAGTEMRKGALVVRFREIRPPRDRITAQVLTSPYVLAAVPKHAGEVIFERLD
jgi:hypothetical protein